MARQLRRKNRALRTAVLVVSAMAVLATACTSAASDGSTTAAEAEPTATSQPGSPADTCEIDDALALLQSGLPTYDYEPAGSYEALLFESQVAVGGMVRSAVRVDQSGTSFTELTIEWASDLNGDMRPDVDIIAWESQWADTSVPDPLREPVPMSDVYFFAFLTPWSGRRGGWNPGVEGLYVSCSNNSPLQPVIEDGRALDDPQNPSLDELSALLAATQAARTASQQPGSEYTDEELRALREDAMETNPTRIEGVRDALVRFAQGGELETSKVAFSARVALGLGADIDRVVDRDALLDRDAWIIDQPGYAQFGGPFSALEMIADGDTQVIVGEHDHCAGPPLDAPPGFENHPQVSIQPAEGVVDSCIAWFSVDLFLDPQTLTIAGVTLALFGP